MTGRLTEAVVTELAWVRATPACMIALSRHFALAKCHHVTHLTL